MQDEVRYWFPAKRYGWGWGFPASWQGWAVFAGFIALVIGGAVTIPVHRSPGVFAAYVAILSLAFVAVCWWKGSESRFTPRIKSGAGFFGIML